MTEEKKKKRDLDEILYSLSVRDIYMVFDSFIDRDESELTDEVVEAVCLKIEAIDFEDMSETISTFIDDAIQEIKEKEEAKLKATDDAVKNR